MKVGSADRIETDLPQGDIGLEVQCMCPAAPAAPGPAPDAGADLLPDQPRAPAGEWQSSRAIETLAIRFNENKIVGKIERQEVVTLRLGSDMTFRFTLYLLGAAGGSVAEARDRHASVNACLGGS